jgi:transposase
MAERFWLSDAQWAAIEPLLPRLGKPRVDDRRVISGILHRYRDGLRWRTIPGEYGPRTTLFNRLNR